MDAGLNKISRSFTDCPDELSPPVQIFHLSRSQYVSTDDRGLPLDVADDHENVSTGADKVGYLDHRRDGSRLVVYHIQQC